MYTSSDPQSTSWARLHGYVVLRTMAFEVLNSPALLTDLFFLEAARRFCLRQCDAAVVRASCGSVPAPRLCSELPAPRRSEKQFGTDLDLSTRDTRAADHAELRRTRGQARIAERSVIQRVEELRPELQRGGLTPSDWNSRILHKSQVEVVYGGSAYNAVSGVTEDAEKVVGEATGVEPPVQGPRTATEVAVANAVGAVQILPANIRRPPSWFSGSTLGPSVPTRSAPLETQDATCCADRVRRMWMLRC